MDIIDIAIAKAKSASAATRAETAADRAERVIDDKITITVSDNKIIFAKEES